MESNKEQDDENFDKIKVFSSDDEKLKILGELLSNKSSRDIIRLLIEKEMYINEIAKKLELRPNLVIHHLQKMESIGLLEIQNKKIIKKGEEHRFFKIPYGMLILPNKSNDNINKGIFKKIFRQSVSFMAIGITAFVSWAILKKDTGPGAPNISGSSNYEPIIVALLIIVIGLSIILVASHKKEKKIIG